MIYGGLWVEENGVIVAVFFVFNDGREMKEMMLVQALLKVFLFFAFPVPFSFSVFLLLPEQLFYPLPLFSVSSPLRLFSFFCVCCFNCVIEWKIYRCRYRY